MKWKESWNYLQSRNVGLTRNGTRNNGAHVDVVGVLDDGVQDALQVVASVVDQVEDAVLLESAQVGELLGKDLLDLVQVLTVHGLDVGNLDEQLQELAALQQLAVRCADKLATINTSGRVDSGGGRDNLQALQLLLERLRDDGRHNRANNNGRLLDLAQDVRDVSLALVEVELEELAVLLVANSRLRLDAAALVDNNVLLTKVSLNIRHKVVDEASANHRWRHDRRHDLRNNRGGREPFFIIFSFSLVFIHFF